MFQGYAQLGGTFEVLTLVVNSSEVPINADAAPTYRVYDANGPLDVSGSMSFKDTASITGATNASPIVITSASHGLSTGTRVTITGVGGNTAANGTFVITRVDANTFSLNSSTGNGSYTSGGTWNVTGLYKLTLTCTENNGFDEGQTYSILISGTISSTAFGCVHTILVA